MNTKNEKLKQRMLEETRRYFIYAAFFTLFFWAFGTYRRLILKQFDISYIHYGYSFVEALILSKIIILGQLIGLGKRFKNMPLIIPTLYQTFIFTLFVMAFDALEHFLIGALHHKSLDKLYIEFIENGVDLLLARIVVMLFVFVLFFAFLELDQAIGKNKIASLFLRYRDKNDHSSTSKIE